MEQLKKKARFKSSCLIVVLWLMHINMAAQNVGIGTTNPVFRLDVRSIESGTLMQLRSSEDSAGSTSLLRFMNNSTVLNNGKYSYMGNLLSGAGSNMVFATAANGLPATEKMRLNYTGFLGIGTDAPAGRLHINMTNTSNDNAIIIDDDENPLVELRRNNSALGFLQLSLNDMKIGTTANNNTGNLVFRTNGGDRMFVAPDGNVGIGTANPLTKLHVVGGSDAGPASNGYVMLGNANGQNIVLDNNEILARDNGAVATLFLGRDNSKVQIGNGSTGTGTRLHITEGSDVALTDNLSGYLMMGSQNGSNIVADNNEIQARNNGVAANLFLQNSGGNIGLGNITPTSQLHMTGSFTMQNTNPVIQLKNNAGTDIGFIQGITEDIQIGTNSTNNTGSFVIRTNGANRMYVDSDGNISIATSAVASGYKLNVNGKAIVEELKVQLSQNWPDYVFSDKYKLKNFDELRTYIATHNHLPNIPSAKQIESSGLEVGDMQRRMMEKIEELTLYVLQLEEKIQDIKQQLKKQ